MVEQGLLMYLHHLLSLLSCLQSGFKLGLHDFTIIIEIMYFIFDSEIVFKGVPMVLMIRAVLGHISI